MKKDIAESATGIICNYSILHRHTAHRLILLKPRQDEVPTQERIVIDHRYKKYQRQKI